MVAGVRLVTALALACAATPGSASPQVPAGWNATGKAQTVVGPVDPAQLGFTQMHEHLFIDLLEPAHRMGYPGHGPIPANAQRFIQQSERVPVPRTPAQMKLWDTEVLSLNLLPVLRLQQLNRALSLDGGYTTKAILTLDDTKAARSELVSYRQLGGGTLVDVTVEGLGRQPDKLRRLSVETGVNVVMGTGFYRWPYHSPAVRAASVNDLAQYMVNDITRGVLGTQVRAGIIGEIAVDASSVAIGPNDPLLSDTQLEARVHAQEARENDVTVSASNAYDPEEIKVLRAAARASQLTGASITLHAGGLSGSYLDVLQEEGADLTRVVAGHSDEVFLDPAVLARFLKRGVALEADYGLQYYATVGPVSPRQLQVLQGIVGAVKQGYANQIVLSLDLCIKLGLKKYGGGGYTWLLEYVLPYLRSQGVSDAQIHQMMVENPRRLLTFAAPRNLPNPSPR